MSQGDFIATEFNAEFCLTLVGITGMLSIPGDTANFPRLRYVGGITADAHLRSAQFPALTAITNNVDFSGCALLEDVDFSALESVDGYMDFSGCVKLRTLNSAKYNSDTAVLTNTATDLLLSYDDRCMERLTRIDGYLDFSGCVKLTKVDVFRRLTNIGGYLSFSGCRNLKNVDGLCGLARVGGYMDFSGCVKLVLGEPGRSDSSRTILANVVYAVGTYAFRKLTNIGGYLNFNKCDKLAVVAFPELATINGDLSIRSCNKLAAIGFRSLITIGGSLAIINCRSVTDITGFTRLVSIDGYLVIACDTLSRISISHSGGGFAELIRIGGDMVICSPMLRIQSGGLPTIAQATQLVGSNIRSGLQLIGGNTPGFVNQSRLAFGILRVVGGIVVIAGGTDATNTQQPRKIAAEVITEFERRGFRVRYTQQ